MKHYTNEYLDFEEYMDDLKEEFQRDHTWLSTAALLLGSQFVLDSLKPHGPIERPFISKPIKITDIS
jgi:hypothetical protein